jgi:phosphatidylinositol kinase/protein kinase (PI-3  family)
VLAMQLMQRMKQIFEEDAHLPIYLRPYEIFVTSASSGQLEFVTDTASVDYLKKKFPARDWTLATFF